MDPGHEAEPQRSTGDKEGGKKAPSVRIAEYGWGGQA